MWVEFQKGVFIMTIKEFYEMADGDYNEALAGLGKEERIYKFLNKFPKTDMVNKIRTSYEAKDFESAFIDAHNLKGMSMNIALVKLKEVSSDLTESLRNGPQGDVEGLISEVEKEYNKVCELINKIEL